MTAVGIGAEAFPSSIDVGVEREGEKCREYVVSRFVGSIHLGPLGYLSSTPVPCWAVFSGAFFFFFFPFVLQVFRLGLELIIVRFFYFSISNQRPQEVYVAALQNVLDHGVSSTLYENSMH